MQHGDGRCRGAALLLLLVLSGTLAGCGSTVEYQPSGGNQLFQSMATPGARVDPAVAASVVSGYRQANGLGPVAIDPALMQLAAAQANAMARADKMGHAVAGSLDKRAKADGYRYQRIAENIAAGHDTLADAFAGWRESRGHRENMLMSSATRFGIAVQQAPRSRFKVYWAMIIAEPAAAPPAQEPASTVTTLSLGGLTLGSTPPN